MSGVLDAEAVVLIVERIIAENPDRTNPRDSASCVYTSRSDPHQHCLVGEFLARMGWYVPAAGDLDNSLEFSDLCHKRDYPLTAVAKEVLSCVQSEADQSASWGLVDVRGVTCR